MTREHAVAMVLRAFWAAHRPVAVTLTDRCMIRTVVGYVGHVSVTGTVGRIDGWEVPTAEVLTWAHPTDGQERAYRQAITDLREQQTLASTQEEAA